MTGTGGGEVGICYFCGHAKIQQQYSGLYHPRKRDHGPFDFYTCAMCGSGITFPPPSHETLGHLYESFEGGLPKDLRKIRGEAGQSAWYLQCARRALKTLPAEKRRECCWIDVGAGAGELSVLMAELVAQGKGLAVDIHDRPNRLARFPSIEWRQINLNDKNFAERLNQKADVVLSISVLEHLPRPDLFLANLILLVKPGGVLYLACPDFGSLASKVLKNHWPYFLPGEHLNMPTVGGMKQAFERTLSATKRMGVHAVVRRITLPYTLQYTLRYFRMERLANFIPTAWTFPLPAGALEAIAKFPAS